MSSHPPEPITFADLTDLADLSSGGGSTIYSATYINTPVAVRKIRITSSESLERYERELELRKNILTIPSHPNILPLVAYCSQAPNYFLVSPLYKGGNLFNVLHKKLVRFGFKRCLELCLQLVDATLYLHEKGLIHRDIKSLNVLLDEHLHHAVLSDFDLLVKEEEIGRELEAREREKNSYKKPCKDDKPLHIGRADKNGPSAGRLKQMVGTLVYLSPEVLLGTPHGFAADIYALGILMNEVASGCVPYVDRQLPEPELHTVLETRFNQLSLRSAISSDGLRPVLASHVPDEFQQIVLRCWDKDPEKRPTCQQLKERLEKIMQLGDEYLSQFAGAAKGGIHNSQHHQHDQQQQQQMSSNMDMSPTSSENKMYADLFALVNKDMLRQREETKKASLSNFVGNPKTLENLSRSLEPVWMLPLRANYGRSKIPAIMGKFSAGVSSTAGKRGEDRMEDRHVIYENDLAGGGFHRLYGVFDGHGGDKCSEYVSQSIPSALVSNWRRQDMDPLSVLVHVFEQLDMAYRNVSSREEDNAGCTALVAMIMPNETQEEDKLRLIVANAGDCRCIAAFGDPNAMQVDHAASGNGVDTNGHEHEPMFRVLTRDHVAADPRERDLVEARGGYFDSQNGRVNGKLVVTRSLGDFGVKPAISATPEIMELSLKYSEKDGGRIIVDQKGMKEVRTVEFLILATDGVWDVMDEATAVKLVKSTVRVANMAAKRIMMEALARGSTDNITVIVVFISEQDAIITTKA